MVLCVFIWFYRMDKRKTVPVMVLHPTLIFVDLPGKGAAAVGSWPQPGHSSHKKSPLSYKDSGRN
jgi:hypothetical protein